MARTRQKRRRRQDASTRVDDGVVNPLAPGARKIIHRTALDILENIGLAEAPDVVVDLVSAKGGHLASDGRLRFPRGLVEKEIDTLPGARVIFRPRLLMTDPESAVVEGVIDARMRSRFDLRLASCRCRQERRCLDIPGQRTYIGASRWGL